MKKNHTWLLAGLLASLAPATALAQSQVSLYGIVDVNLEYVDNLPQGGARSGSQLRMSNSGLQGSRLGFRGSEDLGSGLKTIFTLEHGLIPETGAAADPNRFFNRGAFLGLEERNHRLTVGRQYTSLFDALLFQVPLAYAGAYEPLSPLLGGIRNDRAMKYRYTHDGLQAQVHYAFPPDPTSASSQTARGGFLSYQKNGWMATLAGDQQNGAAVNGQSPKAKKMAVALSYNFDKSTRISAGYRWGKSQSATGTTTLRDDFWWVGLNHKVSAPLTLNLAYYQDQVKERNGRADRSTLRQLTVQGIYALSKGTDLYVAASHAQNAGLNFTALSTLGAGASGQSGVAAGIRHRF